MDIIFKGRHDAKELIDSMQEVLYLFKKRYRISEFNEIHMSVTLIDGRGDAVELVDSQSNQTFRVFEVHRDGFELTHRKGSPFLRLVVDNE